MIDNVNHFKHEAHIQLVAHDEKTNMKKSTQNEDFHVHNNSLKSINFIFRRLILFTLADNVSLCSFQMIFYPDLFEKRNSTCEC
jgi:hypothetical protein